MNHPYNMAPSIYYDASAAKWEPPAGGFELARRNFEHACMLDYSASKPSRFDKIRVLETAAQKQPTAAEIIAKCEAMLETEPKLFPYFERTNECWSDPRAPMRDAEAMMQALLALSPQQEAAIQRAMQDQLKTGIGWMRVPAAAPKADEDIRITVSVAHDPRFNAFNVRATPVMGIDWGAGEEPEPKDTPERARERSEGLCGWSKGVRDTDKPGIAAAAAAEDDYWDSAGFVRTSRLQLQDGRHVTMYRFADEANPSAGLLTIAEPTHLFGGWGATET